MNNSKFLINKQLIKLQNSKFNSNKQWNITWECGVFLSNLVNIKNPNNVLEIGTSNGFSTLWLAKEISINSKIYTIEVDEKRFNEAKSNFNFCNLSNIEQINGEIFEVLENYNFKEINFEIVFLDAAQKFYKEIILKLIKKRLVNKNTIFLCDNVLSHNYMENFIIFMKNKFENVEIIDFESGLLLASSFN